PQPRDRPGVGRMRVWSVNTWIIVINVAVYVFGNILLGGVQYQTSAGTVSFNDATPEQLKRGRLDRNITYDVPQAPGLKFHPIYDPRTPATDSMGRRILSPDGRPQAALIGGE